MSSVAQKIRHSLAAFRTATAGNVVIPCTLLAVPLVGAVGAAVDYSGANSMKSSMQSALDSTALSLIKAAASLTTAQLSSTAASMFTANFNRNKAQSVQVSPT